MPQRFHPAVGQVDNLRADYQSAQPGEARQLPRKARQLPRQARPLPAHRQPALQEPR